MCKGRNGPCYCYYVWHSFVTASRSVADSAPVHSGLGIQRNLKSKTDIKHEKDNASNRLKFLSGLKTFARTSYLPGVGSPAPRYSQSRTTANMKTGIRQVTNRRRFSMWIIHRFYFKMSNIIGKGVTWRYAAPNITIMVLILRAMMWIQPIGNITLATNRYQYLISPHQSRNTLFIIIIFFVFAHRGIDVLEIIF